MLKKIMLSAVLAGVSFLAIPSDAGAWGVQMGPWSIGGNGALPLLNCGNPCRCPPSAYYLAPWYLYYPYDAHFQLPAPTGLYPSWPTQYPPVGANITTPPGPQNPFARQW